ELVRPLVEGRVLRPARPDSILVDLDLPFVDLLLRLGPRPHSLRLLDLAAAKPAEAVVGRLTGAAATAADALECALVRVSAVALMGDAVAGFAWSHGVPPWGSSTPPP